MLQRETGSGLVVGLLVLALLAFGGFYFFSDVFRTKVKDTATGLTEWTPENIADDPVGYLNFAERKTKATQDQIAANKISVKQRMAKLTEMKATKETDIGVGSKALDAMKVAFRGATESGTWPMSYSGKSYDEAAAKKQIVRLHRELESRRKLLDTVNSGLKKLELQQAHLADAEDRCTSQLAEIAASREAVKVQELTAEIKDQLIDMRGALASTTALVGDDDAGSLSLDDIVDAQVSSVDEAEFAEIMK